MPHFVTAEVTGIIEEREGLQKVKVHRADGGAGDQAYVLRQVTGDVAVGDEVILNTTAVELDLGTGGWHIVHWNLARDSYIADGLGHVMKARYTSVQIDAGAGEESMPQAEDLVKMPVIHCFLLSQAAVALLALRREMPDVKVALIVTDQASLPIAISDLIFELRERHLVDVVFSSGQAFGGDVEAVNVASALSMAKASGAQVAIVTEGPGVVGTASQHGFSAFEMAAHIGTAQKLGGDAFLAVRYSEADKRERHQGVSHHAKTVLAHCSDATVAIPSGEQMIATRDHACVSVDVGDVALLMKRSDLQITSMGRKFADDPKFFEYAAAAGIAAAQSVSR